MLIRGKYNPSSLFMGIDLNDIYTNVTGIVKEHPFSLSCLMTQPGLSAAHQMATAALNRTESPPMRKLQNELIIKHITLTQGLNYLDHPSEQRLREGQSVV
jgi:hypothetical protein